MGSVNTQATRSTLTSVDTTLSANISATQDFIPVASITNFSTSVVAEIESTNEVVSFTSLTTNEFSYSEQFDNAYWGKARTTVSADQIAAPDGTTTADEIIQDASNSGAGAIFLNSISGIAAGTVSYSVHAKYKTGSNVKFIFLQDYNATSGGALNKTYFNLETGAVGTTSAQHTVSSTSLGNGWFRFSVTITKAGSGTFNIAYYRSDADNGNTATVSNSLYMWGAQLEEGSLTPYLPSTSSSSQGLTGVTRGVNGTTAQAASSGASIQQLPYALGSLDMPVRLRAISVSPDGTGDARLTLCDNNGDSLCDVDIPDGKSYTLNLPEDGIIFPNGVFVSNTDNITAYTVYTEKYSGPGLTS